MVPTVGNLFCLGSDLNSDGDLGLLDCGLCVGRRCRLFSINNLLADCLHDLDLLRRSQCRAHHSTQSNGD